MSEDLPLGPNDSPYRVLCSGHFKQFVPVTKRPTKGRRYATIEKIKPASKEELKKITKNDFWSASRIDKNVGTSA